VALLLAGIRRCDRCRQQYLPGLQCAQSGRGCPSTDRLRQSARRLPDKGDAEIEIIPARRVGHLGRVPPRSRISITSVRRPLQNRTFIDYTPESIARFIALKNDGKPALVFAAHLANWKLPAVIAGSDGLDSVVLYRRPNLGAIADAVMALRKGLMERDSWPRAWERRALARALGARPGMWAMLVDQHYTRALT